MRIKQHIGNVDIDISDARLRRNLKEAQIALNEKVVGDCDPYIPFSQGGLAGSVEYPKGIAGGEIMYNTPYAHYVYRAEIYGPNIPEYDTEGNIIGWWSPKHKKPTGRYMEFSKDKHPDATKEFFEAAKKAHKDEWIREVKKIVGQD